MDRTCVRTFPLKGLMVCIRPGGEEVLSPGRRVMDVWVSIAHCKKVVFTFLPFSISFSYAHSQYPLQVLFQSVSRRAIFY